MDARLHHPSAAMPASVRDQIPDALLVSHLATGSGKGRGENLMIAPGGPQREVTTVTSKRLATGSAINRPRLPVPARRVAMPPLGPPRRAPAG